MFLRSGNYTDMNDKEKWEQELPQALVEIHNYKILAKRLL